MNAIEAFNAGSLEEAVELAKEQVKKNPTDLTARSIFCEMLCFSGELERADKQLETLMLQDPQAAVGISLFRQLIRAEMARQESFHNGRPPELLREPNDVTRLHLDLLLCLREQQTERARELVAAIDEQRTKISGICDNNEFNDLRDLDDTCASFFEVLTSTGKYYWIPFDIVECVTFHPPVRPRDLMWRRAHMVVQSGPDGEVYLPLLYARSLGSDDKQLRLGRATDWEGGEAGPALGHGLRMMLVGDEDKSLMQITDLEFHLPEREPAADAADAGGADESSGT